MPTPMSNEELEGALKTAVKIDTFEFRNPQDEEDYIMACLYKQGDGHFRLIEQTGMNHDLAGAGNIGERLTAAEVKTWSRF